MVERDLGEATIVYEDPDDGTVEMTVENEHVAYFQDHWIVKTEERDDHDVVRRIPAQRVYHVERSVEEFEEEASSLFREFEREVDTIRDTVRSFTDEIPAGLFGGRETRQDRSTSDVKRIDIEDGTDGLDETDERGRTGGVDEGDGMDRTDETDENDQP